ncbi:MAG: LUD domain-containing protein [Candidatus Bathyarchaeia archaeon]
MVAERHSSFGNVVNEILKTLRMNRFDAVYVRSREEALQSILQRVPSQATVGAGDSLTLKQIGVFEELERRGFTLF